MTEEILRNGVPHKVATSLVTLNAVTPQNIFVDQDAAELGNAQLNIPLTTETVQETLQYSHAAQKTLKDSTPDYPAIKDQHHAHDALATTKSHIKDNIQALKNLAQSDNWQSLPKTHGSQNIQHTGTDALSDNMQSLGRSKSIQDNKLYLEKKSIKDNRQLIAKTLSERSAPHLPTQAAQTLTSKAHAEANMQVNDQTRLKASDETPSNETSPSSDDAFQMRVKRLKSHVKVVSSTLQDLAPDQ